MCNNPVKQIAAIASVITGLIMASPAWAQVISSNTFLPVGGSYYINPPTQPVTFTSSMLSTYGIASIILTDLVHTPGVVTNSGILPSGDFFDQFNSTLTGDATINLAGGGSIAGLLTGSGPTLVVVGDGYTNGAVGGPWGTAMTLNWPVQVTWSGEPPGSPFNFYLACSNAPGSTSVTALGGDSYQVDSFFDVWPEISFDGNNWIPADDSVTMTITPEPSSLALLGLGALALAIRVRKGRK